MGTLRLVLEYDGTDFHGWQSQPGVRTVEGTLRAALQSVDETSERITAAGRTDAGAHAHGQVVGVHPRREWHADSLAAALNAVLPADVAVRGADTVPATFHARFDAVSRTYRYVVLARGRSPLLRRYAWQVDDSLDADRMHRAAAAMEGRHDFAGFGRSPRRDGSTVRTIHAISLRRLALLDDRSPVWVIEVSADAFLYGMMRAIAGALVAVGRRRLAVDDVTRLLTEPSCGTTVTTAPARGLHQWSVTYAPTTAPETAP